MIHRHPIGDQCLPLCEQEENAAHRADSEERCTLLPPLPSLYAIELGEHDGTQRLMRKQGRVATWDTFAEAENLALRMRAIREARVVYYMEATREHLSEEELHDDVADALGETI